MRCKLVFLCLASWAVVASNALYALAEDRRLIAFMDFDRASESSISSLAEELGRLSDVMTASFRLRKLPVDSPNKLAELPIAEAMSSLRDGGCRAAIWQSGERLTADLFLRDSTTELLLKRINGWLKQNESGIQVVIDRPTADYRSTFGLKSSMVFVKTASQLREILGELDPLLAMEGTRVRVCLWRGTVLLRCQPDAKEVDAKAAEMLHVPNEDGLDADAITGWFDDINQRGWDSDLTNLYYVNWRANSASMTGSGALHDWIRAIGPSSASAGKCVVTVVSMPQQGVSVRCAKKPDAAKDRWKGLNRTVVTTPLERAIYKFQLTTDGKVIGEEENQDCTGETATVTITISDQS